MLWFEIQVSDRSSVAALAEGLATAHALEQPLVVSDPNGLAIRFVAPA
jgi:hypothetical protein